MTSLTGRWSRVLRRAASVSFMSTLAVLVFAGPAMATTNTIPLHEPHKNTKAAEFETQKCGPEDWTPSLPGQDGWHFVVPGGGTFVSLTLTFNDGEEDVEKTIPGDGVVTGNGNADGKHAVIYTPAGWTLMDGTAVIEGESANGDFVLSHVCAAELSVSPSPDESAPETGAPDTELPDTELPASEVPSAPSSEMASESPSETQAPATGNGGGLPVTGLALTGVILTGLGMVGAGVAMRALRRRNDETDESGEAPTDV